MNSDRWQETLVADTVTKMAEEAVRRVVGEELKWHNHNGVVELVKEEARKILKDPEIQAALRERLIELIGGQIR